MNNQPQHPFYQEIDRVAEEHRRRTSEPLNYVGLHRDNTPDSPVLELVFVGEYTMLIARMLKSTFTVFSTREIQH